MALVSTPGLIYPPIFPSTGTLAQNGLLSTVADANGEKIAMIGQVWWPGFTSGTKNIDKIGFLFGAVTKTNGSTVTVSLQDVDFTTGIPVRPDGTQDQSITIANADGGFVTNAWYNTGSLSAQRTVSFGEHMAVVWEFGSFVAGDLFNLRNLNSGGMTSSPTLLFTASWAAVAVTQNVLFHFSDGTYGTFASALPLNNASVVAFGNASNPDERGNTITMPFKAVCEGILINANPNGATNEYEVILYDGSDSSVLRTVTQDAQGVSASNSYSYQKYMFSSPITLNAGSTYYTVVKPTSAGTANVPFIETNSADYWQAHPYGDTSWHAVTRVDGGSWTNVTTRRYQAYLILQQIDDGAGSGGGSAVYRPVKCF